MKNIINENQVTTQHLPGRDLRWLFTPEMHVSESFSMNVVVIKPKCTVTPAHSHPEKEEIVYIISGSGKVFIDGEVHDIAEGTTIHFPKGCIHMLRNTGNINMKVVCFFTPQATLMDYMFHEQVQFSEEISY